MAQNPNRLYIEFVCLRIYDFALIQIIKISVKQKSLTDANSSRVQFGIQTIDITQQYYIKGTNRGVMPPVICRFADRFPFLILILPGKPCRFRRRCEKDS